MKRILNHTCCAMQAKDAVLGTGGQKTDAGKAAEDVQKKAEGAAEDAQKQAGSTAEEASKQACACSCSAHTCMALLCCSVCCFACAYWF